MYTVVVVEDSLVMHEIYRLALQDTDFEIVAEAYDGNSAIHVIKNFQPQILILDLVLPGLSGVDVLKKVSDLSPGTKTIVVTSVEDQAVLRQITSLGAIFTIQKPFKKLQFLDKLVQLALTTKEVKYG
jgi:DNA-binding NarL/FixJ family response regulator